MDLYVLFFSFFGCVAILSIFFLFIIIVLTGWTFIFGAGFDITPPKIVRKMYKIANLKENEVVYDLGAGTGLPLIIACKEFKARGVGIEISPIFYLWAKTNVFLRGMSKDIKIRYGNFLNFPISDADVVFLFLFSFATKKLAEKFKKELKPGTRIVSYCWKVPGLPLVDFDKKNKIYLYKI